MVSNTRFGDFRLMIHGFKLFPKSLILKKLVEESRMEENPCRIDDLIHKSSRKELRMGVKKVTHDEKMSSKEL